MLKQKTFPILKICLDVLVSMVEKHLRKLKNYMLASVFLTSFANVVQLTL